MAITQASEEGLKISNAGTNGQYLQKQSGNTGGLTWADVSTDLVADTSPQLGGDLASNGHDIKIADASGYDGNNIYMGSDNDVRIHHDGSNFSITEATGDVTIQAADDIFLKPQGGENGIKVIGDGAVELYHDNSKKLETTSSGIDLPDQLQVDGQAFATGGLKINSDSTKLRLGASDDLEIYHNGTDSIIDNNTGELKIQSDNIQFLTSDASEKFIDCNGNGNVQIFHNNVKTAQTEAGGVWNVRGPTDGNATLMLSANDGGDNGDSWRWLAEGETNTKKITLTNNPSGNWETSFTATGNAGVELYYNNSKKLETDANGIHLYSNVHLPDNGTLELGDGSDATLSHTGSDFNIINNTGTLVLGNNSGTGAGEGQIVFKSGNNNTRWSISSGGDFKPASNNAFAIGSSSYRVSVIYANTSLDTSDRNAKNTIIESDLGLDFINQLKPVSYKWNDDDGKTHYGLIAQDIEETVLTEGKEITDFGFIDKPEEGQMSLAYNELISPLIKAVQELSAEVKALKAA